MNDFKKLTMYDENLETTASDSTDPLLDLGGVGERFTSVIAEMESAILENLANLEQGYGSRKWAISRDTGIPEDVLTVLLKRLKDNGKVELMMIWCEHNGTPNGSGYCLKGKAWH